MTVPNHVAAIMDGNGRWAKRRGLPRVLGHREGVKALREVVRACDDFGAGYLTVYSFSTENWQRPEPEVNGLMKLMASSIDKEQDGLMANNVQVRTIGRTRDLPASVRERLQRLIDATSSNTGLVFTLALSYGGRAEIVDACRRACDENKPPENEAELAGLLYDPSLPDPDLLIRTGGERRISNYLLWQLAYTELYFTDTLWPEFGRDELRAAFEDYAHRQRRFGRV